MPIINYLGGPGTGKTTKLIALAQNQQVQNSLFISYSTIASSLIREQLGKAWPCSTMPGLTMGLISHFQKEMGFKSQPHIVHYKVRKEIADEASKKVNSRMFPTELGYEQEILKEIQQIQLETGALGSNDLALFILKFRKLPQLSSYLQNIQTFYIDDAQEMSLEEFRLIQELSDEGAQVYLASDINSVVGKEQTCSNKLLHLESIRYSVAHQSKPWVCQVFNQLAAFNKLKDTHQIQPGIASQIISQNFQVHVESLLDQNQWIQRQIMNCMQISTKINIGIICRSKSEIVHIAEALSKNGIQHQVLFQNSRYDPPPTLKGVVFLGTPNVFKGMRFQVVILPNMTEGVWPFPNEHLESSRRQLLCSIGRAKSVIFFMCPKQDIKGTPLRPSRHLVECNTPEVIIHRK